MTAVVASLLVAALAAPAHLSPLPPPPDADDDPLGLHIVYPTQAGKNRVRWYDFDWQYVDFTPVEGGAPVRLYFYERERAVAQLARAATERAYRRYVEFFRYTPSRRIPYLLYNSHFEFESTNAFFVSEQLLGVTSIRDLTMSLPYWGEHQRFRHVLEHELAHQFTVQQVSDLSSQEGSFLPLEAIPLWFIEGLAEYASLGGLTPQVRATLADGLLAEAAFDEGDKRAKDHRLPPFFNQGPGTFQRIYLQGHAQLAFIAETWGDDALRSVLSQSPRLGSLPQAEAFDELLGRITATPPEEIEKRWKRWLDEKIGRRARAAAHPFDQVERIDDLGDGQIDALVLSPGRDVAFYRVVDTTTGRTRLYLRELADGGKRREVASDQQVKLVSLHPGDRRVMAIGEGLVAYIGRRGAADRLFVRTVKRTPDGFELGDERVHELQKQHGLIEAGSPAFDPRTGALYFVGLSQDTGFLDIYRLDRPMEEDAPIARVTDDIWAERDLAIGPDGTLVFSSDATPDGRYELFRLEPDGTHTALTSMAGADDALSAAFDPEGAIVFSASGTGFTQAYRLQDGRLTRLTELPTRFEQPAVDRQGNLVGLTLWRSEPELVRVDKDKLLSQPVAGALPGTLEPQELARSGLDDAKAYEALSWRNYRLENIGLAAGTGPYFVGSAVFTDLFRNRSLGVQIEYISDFDRTGGALLYLDQTNRLSWGVSAFIDTNLHYAPDFPTTGDSFLRQQIGAAFILEYPLLKYLRVEGFVIPQFLRAYDFNAPGSAFAEDLAGNYWGAGLGGRLAFDTLRHAVVGPVDGLSAALTLGGTLLFGGADSFAEAGLAVQYFRPIVPSYERVYAFLRLETATTFGGELSEQFYLPAAYNLRAFREGQDELLGTGYWLGTLELRFPLDFITFGFLPYVEGLVGADVGAIFLDRDDLWDNRVADAVLGVNIGLGPVGLRLHFARPFDIGAGVPNDEWLTHVSLSAPFLGLY